MARIVDGPEITGQVTHKQTGQSYGPVTVTVSPKVYTDREMTASVTSLTTDGTGVFSCYAPPGTYTFTTAAVDAATIESVEVLGHEAGTGTPQSAAYSGLAARFLAATARNIWNAFPSVAQSSPTISYTSSASPRPATLIQGGPFTLTGSQGYTYTTTAGAQAGYVAPTTVGNELAPFRIIFDTDSPQFDICYVGSTSPSYRLIVDGEYVTAKAQVAGGSGSGAAWRVNVVFPSRRMRRVVIESDSMFVRSINAAVTDTILPAPAPSLSLAVIGDSYIANGGVDGIAATACQVLGLAPIINGSGGTGYNNNQGGANGKQIFGDRLAGVLTANPSALCVLGAINDSTGTLQADASALIVAAKASKPKMPVILCGSQGPPPDVASAVTKSALLKAAAAASGAFFVDMTTGHVYDTTGTQIVTGSPWVTGTSHVSAPAGDGNADFYIGGGDGTDTVHPYVAPNMSVPDGYVYHGMRLAAALAACLTSGV